MTGVPLLLVDGHNLLFRACFGTPAQIWSRDPDDRRDLTTEFMFFALLRKGINEELPGWPEVVVVFDGQDGSAQRKQADAGYKANRPADSEALKPIRALPAVKAGLDLFGITWVELSDAEADDVIATLAASCPARDVLIASVGQDYYQLLRDAGPGHGSVRVLNTARRAGSRLTGPAEVRARHGITPAQFPDYRALAGDAADNIPGVRGIGAKTAAALLDGGLALEDLPASGRLAGRKGAAITAAWPQVLTWRDMIRMNDQLPVPAGMITGVATPPLPRPAEVIEKLGLWRPIPTTGNCGRAARSPGMAEAAIGAAVSGTGPAVPVPVSAAARVADLATQPEVASRNGTSSMHDVLRGLIAAELGLIQQGSTVTGTTAADADEARRLRDAMTDKLLRLERIMSPAIEAAFRTVPRHAFARPGTPLEECYHGSVVRNKGDAGGVTLSSISAAWLQARMIDQAGIGPGSRVLEIGATGYNAAVIAEVAGPGGHVVTVDIDPEVCGWAAAALEATGYAGRVTVVTGDGEHGVPGDGPFDAIIVTAGAWDIPPAWLAQLHDNGTLVVPLLMNGVTRSIGFRKHDGHLSSRSAYTCGFVPMQGAGARPEAFFTVPAPGGGHITLRFEDGTPAAPPLPGDVLASDPAEAWSGLTIADMTAWSDLYLWLAGFAPGFCRLDQSGGPQLAWGGPVMKTGWYPFAIACDGTLSYLTVRDLPDGSGVEFGALAYGHHATEAATALIGHLHAWDARGRDLPQDAFTYWPDGTALPLPGTLVSVFRKRDGATATISWPPERPASMPERANAGDA